MKITDPCGAEQAGYEQIVACFIKNLMLDHNSHSATVRGYAESINMLSCLQNFPIPADFLDRNNICTTLISGREKEENIARQCSPLSREMQKLGNELNIDSPEAVVADQFTFIRVTGLQVAEHAQQTESKVDVNKGMTPDFMKSRLPWLGESYHLYLCDTSVLQQQHVNALST